MKTNIFAVAAMFASSIAWAVPPSESLIKSCLQAQSVGRSISIRNINVGEVFQEDDYSDGFNVTYIFKYKGSDIGCAESSLDQALMYRRRLYRLSKSIPVGNNRGVKPAAFNPMLAQWSLVNDGGQRYLCVSFNFDGLGRSGSFQRVHGGYLLNQNTKGLYFFVHDVK